MKTKLWTIISLILCLCLAVGTLTGCGNNGEDESDPPISTDGQAEYADIDLTDTVWELGEGGDWYTFQADGTLLVTKDNGFSAGSYEWDGQNGSISTVDGEATIENRGDDGLFMVDEDGQEHQLFFLRQAESSNNNQSGDATTTGTGIANTVWSLEGVIYTFNDDGTMTASDGTDVAYGTYAWDDASNAGQLMLNDVIAEIAMSDDALMLQGEDAQFYPLEYVGSSGISDSDIEAYAPSFTAGGHEQELYGTWIYSVSNDTYMKFDGVDMVEMANFSGSGDAFYYTYSYDGETLQLIDADGDITTGYIDDDGDLNLNGTEGWFALSENNDEMANALDDTVWDNLTIGASLAFEDGQFRVGNASEGYDEGYYTFDGTNFTFELPSGETFTGHVDSEGDIVIDALDGFFYQVDTPGYW